MVIQLGVTRLKKDKVVFLLDLFEKTGKKGHCDLVCETPVDDWVNTGLYWYLIHVSAILILSGDGPILRNGH